MFTEYERACPPATVEAMKLLVFGLSVSSAWGNGHAPLWRGLIQALAALGHSVTFYERNTPVFAAHRDAFEWPKGRLVLYSSFADVRREAAAALKHADVGIVTSYCPDALEAAATVLDAAVPIRAFYDLDTPMTVQRAQRGEHVAYIGPRGLRDFDIVLSCTGGATLNELHRLFGARRAAALYPGVDPHLHSPAAPKAAYLADLSHLGTDLGPGVASSQAALERMFLEPAHARPDLTFAVGGSHYVTDFAWANNVKYLWHVPPYEHSAFYASAHLNLHLTPQPLAALGYCPTARLFEIAASGATIITDAWPGLADFYEPFDEVLVARDTADVLSALSISEREQSSLRRRARERTLAQHTVRQRARQLVDILSGAHAGSREFVRKAAEATRGL